LRRIPKLIVDQKMQI